MRGSDYSTNNDRTALGMFCVYWFIKAITVPGKALDPVILLSCASDRICLSSSTL